MVLVQEPKKYVEEIVLVRCPSCLGLRGVSKRHASRTHRCKECKRGKVIRREEFWEWWLERFTQQEINEMAEALDWLAA